MQKGYANLKVSISGSHWWMVLKVFENSSVWYRLSNSPPSYTLVFIRCWACSCTCNTVWKGRTPSPMEFTSWFIKPFPSWGPALETSHGNDHYPPNNQIQGKQACPLPSGSWVMKATEATLESAVRINHCNVLPTSAFASLSRNQRCLNLDPIAK